MATHSALLGRKATSMSAQISETTQIRTNAPSPRRALARGLAVLAAVLLLGGASGTASADDEDGYTPAIVVLTTVPATPIVTPNFHWSIQFPDGSGMAGISADLPAAIDLAIQGTSLSEAERATVMATLTQQAMQRGVSMTSTAPPTKAPPAAPFPNESAE
jgi:hypothetical protein